MSKEAMTLALEALECTEYPQDHYDAITALREALAKQPAQQEIDWKDQYEKQKRRADMWVAKYEADIGPLEKAGPVTAQQEPVAVVSGYYGGQCVILPIDPARIYNSNTFLYTSPQPCPTCEALARTVMLDQTSHDAQRKPLTITEESAWDLARYVYARSNPHESPQILLSAMEIKQIIEAAYGIKEKNT